MSEIMTCDNEWSHEELYGVAYDECIRACKGLKYLLDNPDLSKPNLLMEYIMDNLDEGYNLVDYYDEFYANKGADDDSDDVFHKWDCWMHYRIQETLYEHKYKGYIRSDQ